MMNFNIQLFADNLQNTTATMSKEMKTFYEKRLIDQAEPRLVHDQFADYYPVPQNGGKTIEFRKYDSLPKATTPLTEGVTPNGQALNVTTITSDLHQYGGWTPLTDVLQMTAIDNNVVQVAGDGGHVQGLAVGSHALGQRSIGLGQAVVLAELNGLAAVLGYGIVVRELVMHQTGLCLVDKALLVEGLHLVGHGAGGVLQAGRRVGKELEVHLQVVAFHVICPFCIKIFKN